MNVAVFTVIKDERDYLDDFLRYHTEMGLHIFVFEDLFSVSHMDICDRYPDVELHSVKELYEDEEMDELVRKRTEKVPCQTEFINRGLKYIHSLGTYQWTALIDIDEYITCTEEFPDILERYKSHDSVLIYWKNYGYSGHIYKPDVKKPPYEIYTEPCGYELYSDYKYYKITKFIVNMDKWKPTQKYFIHCANVDFVKADGTFKRTEIVYEPLYLRHYITRSLEEYCWKVWVRLMHHNGHRQLKSLYEMCPETKGLIDDAFRSYFRNKYGVDIPEE